MTIQQNRGAFSVQWQGASGPAAEDRLIDIYEHILGYAPPDGALMGT